MVTPKGLSAASGSPWIGSRFQAVVAARLQRGRPVASVPPQVLQPVQPPLTPVLELGDVQPLLDLDSDSGVLTLPHLFVQRIMLQVSDLPLEVHNPLGNTELRNGKRSNLSNCAGKHVHQKSNKIFFRHCCEPVLFCAFDAQNRVQFAWAKNKGDFLLPSFFAATIFCSECFIGVQKFKPSSSRKMRSNGRRNGVRLAENWLWIRSQRHKVPTMRTNDKKMFY